MYFDVFSFLTDKFCTTASIFVFNSSAVKEPLALVQVHWHAPSWELLNEIDSSLVVLVVNALVELLGVVRENKAVVASGVVREAGEDKFCLLYSME